MNPQLVGYFYYASRLAVVSLMPAIMYWLISDFWMALKVFFVFLAVGQLSAVWVYRKELMNVLRQRRRSR